MGRACFVSMERMCLLCERRNNQAITCVICHSNDFKSCVESYTSGLIYYSSINYYSQWFDKLLIQWFDKLLIQWFDKLLIQWFHLHLARALTRVCRHVCSRFKHLYLCVCNRIHVMLHGRALTRVCRHVCPRFKHLIFVSVIVYI